MQWDTSTVPERLVMASSPRLDGSGQACRRSANRLTAATTRFAGTRPVRPSSWVGGPDVELTHRGAVWKSDGMHDGVGHVLGPKNLLGIGL
jgi:hypothetical protein